MEVKYGQFDGGKYLDVDCGVGEVNLSFTE